MLQSVGVGIDVVDISDFSQTLSRSGETFIQSVFTDSEIAYCQGRPPQHFAVRWAAKEAFFKALRSNDSTDIEPIDIEVVSEVGRTPEISLSKKFDCWTRMTGVESINVSLSHSRHTAIAVVLINYQTNMTSLNTKGVKNMVTTATGPLHALESSFPHTKECFENLVTAAETESTLDERTREMILIGMLTTMGAFPGIQFHARRAIELGASKEDLLSVVTLALPVSGIAATVNGLRAINEILR